MPESEYSKKLRDVRWQKLRLEVLSRANWRCEWCGAGGDEGGVSLHVHHVEYRRDAEPWEYDLWELVAACEECHALEHEHRKDAEADLLSRARQGALTAGDLFGLAYACGRMNTGTRAVFVYAVEYLADHPEAAEPLAALEHERRAAYAARAPDTDLPF